MTRDGCALVTDAPRGAGPAIARALAQAGWPVAIHHRGGEAGERLAEEIVHAGGEAAALRVELGAVEAAGDAFDALERQLGPVLVLVNNGDADALDGVVSCALWSATRSLPAMREAGFGRVVNVAAPLDADWLLRRAVLPTDGNGDGNGHARNAARAAARAGLIGLTRTLAAETAASGVTVNAVTPGLVDVEIPKELRAAVPFRRAATSEEVAGCVGFLASEAASYVTGTTLPVDGGLAA
ncbi:MAG TPA: SDR family oxidoreductase [Thermoleophilaceae bacterium]